MAFMALKLNMCACTFEEYFYIFKLIAIVVKVRNSLSKAAVLFSIPQGSSEKETPSYMGEPVVTRISDWFECSIILLYLHTLMFTLQSY